MSSGSSITIHENEDCSGDPLNVEIISAEGRVEINLKDIIADDGEYTYYAKRVNGEEVLSCIEIKYTLDRTASSPTLALPDGITSPSNNAKSRFLVSGVEDGSKVSLHTDSGCTDANQLVSAIARSNSIALDASIHDNGSYVFYAKQVDRASNSSDCSGPSPTYKLIDVPVISQIVARGNHSCFRFKTGEVRCWGAIHQGSLSDEIDQISLGFHHDCALLSDKTVKCWGGNGKGQLGDGTKTSTNEPIDTNIIDL